MSLLFALAWVPSSTPCKTRTSRIPKREARLIRNLSVQLTVIQSSITRWLLSCRTLEARIASSADPSCSTIMALKIIAVSLAWMLLQQQRRQYQPSHLITTQRSTMATVAMVVNQAITKVVITDGELSSILRRTTV